MLFDKISLRNDQFPKAGFGCIAGRIFVAADISPFCPPARKGSDATSANLDTHFIDRSGLRPDIRTQQIVLLKGLPHETE